MMNIGQSECYECLFKKLYEHSVHDCAGLTVLETESSYPHNRHGELLLNALVSEGFFKMQFYHLWA